MKKIVFSVSIFCRAVFQKNWVSSFVLIFFGILYLLPSLKASFIGDNDYWSNLLPIIHFRNSILNEHELPSYTSLWYGGRPQWQNPLWSFLYLPSTFIWLVLPLDWGARVVVSLHLIFSLLVGKKLGSLFINKPLGQISISIILTAPMLPALLAGHLEKILSWGWVLLAVYFLIDNNRTWIKRGLFAGLCWGIIAITGSNYYVLYTGLLILPLTISYRKMNMVLGLLMGSMIGLLHLPSVLYLLDYSRANSDFTVFYFSTNLFGVFSSLSTGYANPYGWESWSLIGLPMVYLFFRTIFIQIKEKIEKKPKKLNPQKIAILISMVCLILFTTGVIYRGHHFLNTFRIPVRAIVFVALSLILYLLLDFSAKYNVNPTPKYGSMFQVFLLLSLIQIIIVYSIHMRPPGSTRSPYDVEVQRIAEILIEDKAKSVWVNEMKFKEKNYPPRSFQESTVEYQETYFDVVLTNNGLALPNVYYGDLGQVVSTTGPYCGYSFDHVISPDYSNALNLVSKLTKQKIGEISEYHLHLIDSSLVDNMKVYIYRISCE